MLHHLIGIPPHQSYNKQKSHVNKMAWMERKTLTVNANNLFNVKLSIKQQMHACAVHVMVGKEGYSLFVLLCFPILSK